MMFYKDRFVRLWGLDQTRVFDYKEHGTPHDTLVSKLAVA